MFVLVEQLPGTETYVNHVLLCSGNRFRHVKYATSMRRGTETYANYVLISFGNRFRYVKHATSMRRRPSFSEKHREDKSGGKKKTETKTINAPEVV